MPASGTPRGLRLRQETAQKMADLILAALGGGVLLRGGIGASRLMAGHKPPTGAAPYAQRIDVMTPRKPIDEDETSKLAAVKEEGISDVFRSGPAGVLAKWISPMLEGKGFWQGGDTARTSWQIPAYAALGIPAAVLTGIGGYTITDKLLDARRKAEKKEELESAKKRYLETIQAGMAKRSADMLLDDLADTCIPEMEKLAKGNPWIPDFIERGGSTVTGLAAMYAVLAAAAAGKGSYDFFRKRDDSKVTEEAMRRRARQRAGGVPPMYAMPTEIEPETT